MVRNNISRYLGALLALTIGSVHAQTPFYIGELAIEPRLHNGKCLTAASNTNGASVTIQPCTGTANQKWVFTNGNVRVHGNKCLDVIDGKNVNGQKLQIWTCNTGNTNQQWSYSRDYKLSWVGKSRCLDLTDGLTTDGNRIQIWGCNAGNNNQVWNTGYHINSLPAKSQNGQYGTNACGTTSSQNSNCQTLWVNSATDFCVWGPPLPNSVVGDTEREQVAWCSKSGRGTRTFPSGTLTGVHFVKTKDYVQVTGIGNFTKINIRAGDDGGEMDGHGADGRGNPIGGLVYGNTFGAGLQYHEWTNFMGHNEFCIRACRGPNAARNCQHIYDVMGCYWNIPANYNPGFENCDGDNAQPMGVYGTSTWYQGVKPTPAPHPAPKSSNCAALPTITVSPL